MAGWTINPSEDMVGKGSASVPWTYFFGALGGLLFGYDIGVIGGALLFIRQDMHFGPWLQGIVVSALMFGAIIGAALCSWLANKFGPRRLLITAGFLLAAGSLGAALSGTGAQLIGFRAVIGVGVGIASAQVPIYLSEMAPTRLRGALSTVNQIMISGGIVIAYLISYLFSSSGSWRMMIGLAVIPAILLIIGMWCQPESPRWLFRHNRREEAVRILRRNRSDAEVESELNGMLEAGKRQEITLVDLLSTQWMRRSLFLAVGLALLQQFVGINTIIYYAPTIFRAAGFGNATAILTTFGLAGLTFIVTVCTSQLVDRLGRRPMMMGGALALCITMAIIGFVFLADKQDGAIGVIITIACIALYKVAFSLSWGPLVWILLPEVVPLRARSTAVGVAATANWVGNYFVGLLFPIMLQVGAGAIFEIFAGFALIAFFFTKIFLHETARQSLEQIELKAP